MLLLRWGITQTKGEIRRNIQTDSGVASDVFLGHYHCCPHYSNFPPLMAVCPNSFQCHRNQHRFHLLKTLKDRNPLSQKLSRRNLFCIPFVGLNIPLPCKGLGCFRKCVFRLLELRKEKRARKSLTGMKSIFLDAALLN